jgi:hypothetical protein
MSMFMQQIRRCIAVAGALMLLTIADAATPVPFVRLDKLVSKSETIIFGTVESTTETEENRDFNGRTMMHFRSMVKVLEVLKGTLHQGELIAIDFELPMAPQGWVGIPKQEPRLIFLRNTSDRTTFNVADVYYPSLPALKPTAGSPDLISRIKSALEGVILDPAQSHTRINEALSALYLVPDQEVIPVFRRAFATSRGWRKRQVGEALLLRNDTTSLSFIVAQILSLSDVKQWNPEDLNLVYSLNSVHRADAAPKVSKLTSVHKAEVTRAAALCLRSSGSPAAISALKRLLRSTDTQTGYYAALGLAELNHDPRWAPTLEQFKANHQQYQDHWLK